MIGAMKRKASLSLSETSSSANNIQPGACNNGHHHPRLEKRIRWDGPRTQSLIEHYKNNEYLWNPKLADYKNDKKRTHSLEIWLAHNNLDPGLVNEVKMKLHGLRTSFGHQLKLEYASLNEIEKGVKMEDSGPFVSKWQWYNQLSFLRDTMTFRSTSNSNLSPTESPPPGDHGSHLIIGHTMNQQIAHQHQHHEDELMKSETPSNLPIDMQVMPHYASSVPPETHDYAIQHHHHHGHSQQPHNLSVSSMPNSIHDPHSSAMISHSRKDEEDPLAYHHGSRITATPPMAHMQSITSQHSQQPTLAQELSRFQNGCCSCNSERRPALAEKLGRLVEETMTNLHPEYQDMAKIEIQQVLGKYLQKPIP